MWIESHDALRHHPKTVRLAKLLDLSVPAAIGHLHCLWWWAMTYAPDGDLSRFEPQEIADAAAWDADPERLLLALDKSGWTDDVLRVAESAHTEWSGTRKLLHDWRDHGGKLLQEKRRNAIAQKRFRRKKSKTNVSITLGTRKADVSGRGEERRGEKRREEKTRETRARSRASSAPVDAAIAAEFDRRVWQVYPRTRLGDKATALAAYAVLPETDRLRCAGHLAGWVQSADWQRDAGRFVVSINRFFAERRWETPPPRDITGVSPPPTVSRRISFSEEPDPA